MKLYFYANSCVSKCFLNIIVPNFQKCDKVVERAYLTICLAFFAHESICVSSFKDTHIKITIMQFPKSPSVFENESPVPDNEVECGEI